MFVNCNLSRVYLGECPGSFIGNSCFSVIVASLMVADVISPTLSRTNSPTPQHNNDYPFTPIINYTILPISRTIHSIHTHDLNEAYTRRTLMKSFTKIHHDISRQRRTVIYSTRRDGSSFMLHKPCQRCKYTTSVDIKKKRAIKKLFTHVESHASAVSPLESGE